ncbi:unnamed protein product, partial [Rotaria socialis]
MQHFAIENSDYYKLPFNGDIYFSLDVNIRLKYNIFLDTIDEQNQQYERIRLRDAQVNVKNNNIQQKQLECIIQDNQV